MATNKVKQVAAMFGKNIGERFKVRDTFTGEETIAYFTKYGLHFISIDGDWEDLWLQDLWRQKLISGMVEVVD